MRALLRTLSQLSINANTKTAQAQNLCPFITSRRPFSTEDGSGGKRSDWAASFGGTGSSGDDPLGWDVGSSSWSTGLSKEHFEGEAIGKKVIPNPGQSAPSAGGSGRSQTVGNSNARSMDQEMALKKTLEAAKRWVAASAGCWGDREDEAMVLMKQVREPGARGAYLKDSEKAEMYKKHKENPEVYTVEKLAKEYRIMRQRVHAILFLKEDEEVMEKKHGPLDDSIEHLFDTCPEFFNYHDREFHVATLRYKPDFKVMPEGWDGTTRDPDEVHYEISMKEDGLLYEDFLGRFNFNKMKIAKMVKSHKYSRRRPSQGWNFMLEKLGSKGKRGRGGGWKFISEGDGSTRPLNDLEKMFVKRETPRRRRKIFP